MFRISLILFGFTLGLLSTKGQATTYYLDSASGSDFGAGVSVTSALKTLRSASNMVYHPGDQILFKAGSVWKGEELNITTSDEPGAPIIVGSYGIGNQPVLDGANISSSAITLNNAHGVIIQNLTIQNARTLITINGGSSNTVRSCHLVNASVFGAYVASSAFTFSGNIYTTTGSFAMLGDAIRVQAAVSGLLVTGNTITLNYASRGSSGIYILDVNNAEISYNTVTGGTEAIGIKAYTRSVTGEKVHHNKIYYTDSSAGDGESIELTGRRGTSLRASGSVYYNFIQGSSNTINAIAMYQATNVAAYNNTVTGPLRDAAFHWTMYSTGGLIHNNTISGSVPYPFVVLSGSSAKIYSNTTIR